MKGAGRKSVLFLRSLDKLVVVLPTIQGMFEEGLSLLVSDSLREISRLLCELYIAGTRHKKVPTLEQIRLGAKGHHVVLLIA